jgi:microcystin degradation protein MlrC
MRILVGAIGHESNTFTPFLTTLKDFRPRYGQDTLAPSIRHNAFGGIITTLQAHPGVTLVPSVTAHAMPGGVVERAAFETLKGALLDAAHDVDGACIFLHGAMRAEDVDYAENDILTALRAQLGPDVPITVALDMHANIVAETAQTVNAMVAYHTAPHDDAYETGVRAAEMLLYLLEGGLLTFWAHRADFNFHTEAYPVDEAVRVAMAAPESTVFLSDSGDNPGAGGTTDVTVVLESLLRQGATNTVVAAIWDAESVAACIAAGVGREVSLSVGGKLDVRHGEPLPVTGIVRLISDGDYYRGGVREPERLVHRGPVVVLTVAGVDVVLSANRLSIEEPAHLRSLGIEPLAYKIVVPKRGYLTTPLHVISPRSILAISPGVTNCDVRQLEYRRVNRPMYPLDEF